MKVGRALGRLGAALVLVACTPSGPSLGGQTGDPGVAEPGSLDPAGGGHGMGTVGSCGIVGIMKPTLGEDLQGQQLQPLGGSHLVWLDPARGLSIVDASEPRALRIVSRVPMRRLVGDLHIAGKRALITRRTPIPAGAYYPENGYPQIAEVAELIAIDLSEPALPRTLASIALERPPRFSQAASSGDHTHLFVLSDGGPALGCYAPAGSPVRLASYDVSGDHPVLRSTLALGQDLRGGISLDDALLLQLGDPDDAQHRLVWLSGDDGAMLSVPLEAPDSERRHVHAAHRDGATLRVVTSDWTGERSIARVLSYDVLEPNVITLRSACDLHHGLLSPHISFTPSRVLIAEYTQTGKRLISAGTAADGSCDVQTMNRSEGALLSTGVPETILDVEGDPNGALLARLRASAGMNVLAEAAARPQTGLTNVALGMGATAFPGLLSTSASEGGTEPGLLAVAFWGTTSSGLRERGLQLFSFSPQTIRARGALTRAEALLPAVLGKPLAWSLHKLSVLDTADLDAPRPLGGLDIKPFYTRAWAYEQHWIRLRSQSHVDPEWEAPPTLSDNPLSSDVSSKLEVVARTDDPDFGAPIASLDVDPRARFVQVAKLLVSFIPQTPTPELTTIEVIDLSVPEQPRRRGSLLEASLQIRDNAPLVHGPLPWVGGYQRPRHCLDCPGPDLETPVMALPNALVLRVTSGGASALRALDLRDPDQPLLSEPISMELPAEGRILSAFASGTSVYYTYLVASSQDSSKTPPEARFYFRAVDFSTPAQPSLGPVIDVPGQLLAVAGDNLYTREFVRQGDQFEALLQRLVPRDGRVVPEATRSLGGRMPVALQLDGAGHLLVDLREQLDQFFRNRHEWLHTDLAVLDAHTLEVLGQTRVGPQARRLAVNQGRVLYDAAEGVVIVDARVPSAPEVQAYLPLLNATVARLPTAGGSLLVQDAYSIEHIDLNFANLLP